MARILKDEEKKRIKSAAYNILDKVTAILEETKTRKCIFRIY